MSQVTGYCQFCRADTYLPCREAEQAERCQLPAEQAMDYDCAEAACASLFEQWWEFDAAGRKAWRAKMIKALASAKAVETSIVNYFLEKRV